jgi:hypothetical protein
MVAELFLMAGGALKLMAEVGCAAFGSQDPGAKSPRRIVAEMLGVTTFEIGDPVALSVLVKSDDFAGGHS